MIYTVPMFSDQSTLSSPKKIATWNVNSIKVRLPHILQWLEKNEPDVLALQETKITDENFPRQAIEAAGYQVTFSGQKTFNGVAILSRQSAQDVITDIPDLIDPQRRILIATLGDIRIVNLYVPNGQSLDSEKYSYKLNWLVKVKQHLQTELSQCSKIIVLGDFNIAPEEQDVHDPDVWRNTVLFAQSIRDVFQDILSLGFQDAFRLFEQPAQIFSWWDYRNGAFWRNQGLRIDHILVSHTLARECQHCTIDKSPRKLKQPSDHTPVLLTLR